jgi:hypothetical protein
MGDTLKAAYTENGVAQYKEEIGLYIGKSILCLSFGCKVL